MLLCLHYDFSTYKKINTSSWIYRLMNAAAGNNVYMAFFLERIQFITEGCLHSYITNSFEELMILLNIPMLNFDPLPTHFTHFESNRMY